MAQIGSALPWGGRGRGFKSRHSDHKRALKKMPKRKALIYQGFSAFSGQVFQHRFYRCQTAKILYWQDLNPQIAKIALKGVWRVKNSYAFFFCPKSLLFSLLACSNKILTHHFKAFCFWLSQQKLKAFLLKGKSYVFRNQEYDSLVFTLFYTPLNKLLQM